MGYLNRIVVPFLLTILIIPQIIFAGPLEDCQEYASYGIPSNDGTLICRKGYLLSYDPYFKNPTWVAEHLTREKASGKLKRSGSFKADPCLKVGERAELVDYKNSGFDRGHMAPSANMAWNSLAMKESFYLSNMVPQNANMNQRIWKALEEKVRKWALARGEVYIYTGPIYKADEVDVIGNDEVCVPTHIYKIIFDPKRVEGIAFIMPNQPLSTSDMENYIVSIREVEEQTNLDFFKSLNKSVEDAVEKEKAVGLW